jgi:Fic/DOC family
MASEYAPNYRIIGKIAKALMAIEADRQAIGAFPLTAPMLDSLRRTARLLSTHLSTQIEGNRLTQAQVDRVVAGEGNFPGRERDEAEVRHYFAALEHVERLGRKKTPFSESEIRVLHGLVMSGKPRATPYRDGQNVIRDSRTGHIVYMPPEAKEVAGLVRQLVRWKNASLKSADLPVPIVAALVHYQFATIHSYFDGNGRTARLLTTLLLHRGGYGLHGIYWPRRGQWHLSAAMSRVPWVPCMAPDGIGRAAVNIRSRSTTQRIDGYYAALSVGPSHNYHFGRAEADVTGFVEYFCVGMADAFSKVRSRAEDAKGSNLPDRSRELRDLTPQQRSVLGLFRRARVVTARDVAKFFKMKPRSASLLCSRWSSNGFFTIEDRSTKGRSYRLADEYESLFAESE